MITISPCGDPTENGELKISLSGSIKVEEARAAKTLLFTFIESSMPQYKTISADVSGIENVSSAAVAVLLSGLRAAKKFSCDLHYENLPELLFNMARVGGVEGILVGASKA